MPYTSRALPFQKAELLCKIDSLAAEARLMRQRERRHLSQARRMSLRNQLIDALEAGQLSAKQVDRFARRVLRTRGIRDMPAITAPALHLDSDAAYARYVLAVNSLRRNGIHQRADGTRSAGFANPARANGEWIESHMRDYHSLRAHRVVGVRSLRYESRAALLAYAFLRGDDYATVERESYISDARLALLLSAMSSIASRFRDATTDPRDLMQSIERWCQEARTHASAQRAMREQANTSETGTA